jgi:MFS family permease
MAKLLRVQMRNITKKEAKFFVAAFTANIAHSILVYSIVIYSWQLTVRETTSGIAFFTLYFPVLFLTTHAGKLADTYSRFLLVTISQSISGMVCIGLVLLFATTNPSFWILLSLTFVYGVSITYSGPAKFAAVVDVSSRDTQEKTTIKLHILYFIAMGVGPIISGGLAKYFGASCLFGIVACLFGISSIFIVQLYFSEEKNKSVSFGESSISLKQIFKLMPRLVSILSLVALVMISMSGPVQTLIPIFSIQMLGLDKVLAGAMMTPFSIGLVIGGATSHKFLSKKSRGQIMIISIIIGLVSACLLGFFSDLVTATLCLTTLGISGGFFSGLASASLQHLADNSFRGQVMGLYSLLITGTTAIGGLLASFISQKIGVSNSFIFLAIFGGFCLFIISTTSKFYLFNIGIKSYGNLNSMTSDS